MKLVRTNSDHSDFIELIKHLDSELAIRDGEQASWFAQHNKVPNLETVIIAYEDNSPIGCGAFKKFDDKTAEVKRMFVFDHQRGKGVASQILNALENWAREMSYSKCILETGINQPEAIRLYEKNLYVRMATNFPPYAGVKESICFEKVLKAL